MTFQAEQERYIEAMLHLIRHFCASSPAATADDRFPQQRWTGFLLVGILALGSGCASLPAEVERPVSYALKDSTATALAKAGQAHAAAVAARSDSGFFLLDNPARAFEMRMRLIEASEKTLDIQYYAIHADETTDQLIEALRKAAARGVRVRLLLDDFNATGKNAQVLQLAFVPGMELRLFNPLPGTRGSSMLRVLGSITNIDRIQRRMHNKILVADNAMSITGGRNLGENYFGQSPNTNFVDIDVLATGRIVRDLSRSFDQYWNNPLSYPAETLVSKKELDALKTPAPDPAVSSAPASEKQAPPASPLSAFGPLTLEQLPWVWAPSVLMVDKPSKIEASAEETQEAEETLVDGLLQLVSQARRELLIVTPYFVPGPRMMAQLTDIRHKGVRVRVLTNSLASNDAPAAHVGYARYREQLVAAGIELYEMHAEQRGSLAVIGSSADSRASLHSKIIVMDERLLVVGSMNLDLRSQLQNTEVALLIRSPRLAQEALRRIIPTLEHGAYRIELTNGQLLWRAPTGAHFKSSTTEPDASLGLKLLTKVISPFAPDEML